MNVYIKDRNDNYEICLLQVTQFTGTDICKKRFIIESIEKYFSAYKYMEYENYMEANIVIDNEIPGRKYFDVTVIKNHKEIIKEVKLNRNSLASKCVDNILKGFVCQKELDSIQESLNLIFAKFNSLFSESDIDIRMDYRQENTFDIVHKGEILASNNRVLEELSYKDLIINYINLLEKVQSFEGKKKMIILENIDHYLNKNEYLIVMKKIKEAVTKSDLWIIVTTSLEGYVFIDNEFFQGINCVNDIIYNMPSYDEVIEYIENNYPVNLKLIDYDIEKMLKSAINYIGNEYDENHIRGYIIGMLFNNSLCINRRGKKLLTVPEREFL